MNGEINNISENNEIYYIDLKDSRSFCLEKRYGIIPKIGDIIKLHTVKGLIVRGVDINEESIFYKSNEQLDQEYKKWCKDYEKKKQLQFNIDRKQLDEDYELLPIVFKERINKFRSNNPKFRVDYESYEMFCCKEAIKIAEALKTAENIKEFSKLDYNNK